MASPSVDSRMAAPSGRLRIRGNAGPGHSAADDTADRPGRIRRRLHDAAHRDTEGNRTRRMSGRHDPRHARTRAETRHQRRYRNRCRPGGRVHRRKLRRRDDRAIRGRSRRGGGYRPHGSPAHAAPDRVDESGCGASGLCRSGGSCRSGHRLARSPRHRAGHGKGPPDQPGTGNGRAVQPGRPRRLLRAAAGPCTCPASCR